MSLTLQEIAAIPALTPKDKWPQWVRDMHVEGAEVEVTPEGRVVWWGGTIHDGLIVGPIDFLGGSIRDGIWIDGNFMRGIIDFVDWRGGYFGKALWRDGLFRAGQFNGGLWLNGCFLGGDFVGDWRDGVFKGGTFRGAWHDGIYVGGKILETKGKDYEEITGQITSEGYRLSPSYIQEWHKISR